MTSLHVVIFANGLKYQSCFPNVFVTLAFLTLCLLNCYQLHLPYIFAEGLTYHTSCAFVKWIYQPFVS